MCVLFAKKHKLYIVGGYVRDSYLNIQSTIRDDIDLCSSADPKKLKKIFKEKLPWTWQAFENLTKEEK